MAENPNGFATPLVANARAGPSRDGLGQPSCVHITGGFARGDENMEWVHAEDSMGIPEGKCGPLARQRQLNTRLSPA